MELLLFLLLSFFWQRPICCPLRFMLSLTGSNQVQIILLAWLGAFYFLFLSSSEENFVCVFVGVAGPDYCLRWLRAYTFSLSELDRDQLVAQLRFVLSSVGI